jgi:ABC-type multidrug transport system fused ATPase/permease subunit
VRHAFRHLPRLLPYAKPHRRALALSACLMVLGVIASLGAPWPLALLIDSALGNREPAGWLRPSTSTVPSR